LGRTRKSTSISEEYALIGLRIRELRESRKMTQEEISEQMHISKTSVVNYESGTRKIPLSMVKRYAEFFNASVDDLIGIHIKSKQTVYFSNPKISANLDRWFKEIGEIELNEKEMEELIAYSKYVVYRRNHR